jgi:hypothetical protein
MLLTRNSQSRFTGSIAPYMSLAGELQYHAKGAYVNSVTQS